MNTFSKSLIAGSVLAVSTLSTGTVMAAGSLSGNIGFVSDYIFRGIDQLSGATASGGLDYDFGNGLAVGVWAADVYNGIEYDLYGSYSGEVQDFSYSVGFTTYNYTNHLFDSGYTELNLSAGYGPVTIAYADGTHAKNTAKLFAFDESKYGFLSITFEQGGFYGTYGTYSKDAEGNYVELGYGTEVGGFDAGVAIINASDKVSSIYGYTDGDGKAAADTSMVFSLGKSFDL